MNQKKIRQEAKKIMDDFIKELEKVKLIQDFGLKRKEMTRIPKKEEKDPSFKERMFKNAPKVKDDFIVAEKKTW